MGRQGRHTTREKSCVTGVMEPYSSKKQRDGVGKTILSEERSLIVSVEELYHGNPDRYPALQKAYQSSTFTPTEDKATLHLVNKSSGIHLILYKEQTLEGIAKFKFVADGEFVLEARVFQTKRCVEIFKYSKTSKKKSVYWVVELGRDQNGKMAKTREFWDTLCHYFQSLSLEQLRYVNLPRRQALVGHVLEPENPSTDSTSEAIQNTLVLFVHGDAGTQGAEWVFTGWFARDVFRETRKELLEGQTNDSPAAARAGRPQKVKPKKGGRNRRR